MLTEARFWRDRTAARRQPERLARRIATYESRVKIPLPSLLFLYFLHPTDERSTIVRSDEPTENATILMA